jgi:hypothetical protein
LQRGEDLVAIPLVTNARGCVIHEHLPEQLTFTTSQDVLLPPGPAPSNAQCACKCPKELNIMTNRPWYWPKAPVGIIFPVFAVRTVQAEELSFSFDSGS